MSGHSTLVVGSDVPWVTSWSGEQIVGAAPCQTVGGRLALMQASDPGSGKPQYSKNHLVRQRLTVVRMLCPMCGEPTAEGDAGHRSRLAAALDSFGRAGVRFERISRMTG